MNRKLSRFWNYLPLLHIYIELPFLTVRTSFMYRRHEMDAVEYIALDIHLYKWHWEIKLYDTFKRMQDR